MKIVTLDFETYYDKQYSLSKMTTEEYIRDERFEVIGVAVQVKDGEPDWFSGTKEKTKAFLERFALHDHIVVAHNAMFDMAILNWHFDIRPKRIVDTLSMARALHTIEVGGSLAALAEYYELGVKGTEVVNALGKKRLDFTAEELSRYGAYCSNDVSLTYKLFQTLGAGFPLVELKLIDLTIRMFTEPKLELDAIKLKTHLQLVGLTKAQFLSNYNKEDLMSNPKFAELLRAKGVEPPMKISPTTGKETYAFSKTDEGFKELQEHPNLHVQALAAARLGVKSTIEETRTQRFLDISGRGKLPIPLRYYGAHTGRWAGSELCNMQNLPKAKASALKIAICAPDGYLMVDSDSSQIEARTLAWLAGQDDLVEFFEKNNEEIAAGVSKKDMQYDPYKIMAAQIYGKPIGDITDGERFVGKTTILGAGYGMGAARFRVQLKTSGVDLPQEECDRIIKVYRETYPKITALWKQAGKALEAIMRDATAPLGREGVVIVEGSSGIRLPNGLYLKYPNLRRVTNAEGKDELVYDTKRGKQTTPNRIYGGKVVENCIAEGTEVLTDRGWVCIEEVSTADMVHDGIEFVSHGGRVFKSVQSCVSIDGVYMTPDHEVLTNEGWKAASQNPKPYRPDIRYVDGVKSRTQRWKETTVALPMHMRDTVHQSRSRRNQGAKAWGNTQLRMRNSNSYIECKQDAWYEQTPCFRGMAVDAGSLSIAHASGMGELWRARHNRMQEVADVFPELLGRHGGYLRAWTRLRSNRQQRWVFSKKLSVGSATTERHEQAEYGTQGRRMRAKPSDRYRSYNSVLPSSPWLARGTTNKEARCQKQVYDILNAGPRSRFVVRGDSGAFIVHNCCQALARIIIGEQMLTINRKYPVVMTVHDAIACLIPEDEVKLGMEFVELIMRMRPEWALDLPLNCEAGYGKTYGEC